MIIFFDILIKCDWLVFSSLFIFFFGFSPFSSIVFTCFSNAKWGIRKSSFLCYLMLMWRQDFFACQMLSYLSILPNDNSDIFLVPLLMSYYNFSFSDFIIDGSDYSLYFYQEILPNMQGIIWWKSSINNSKWIWLWVYFL